MGEFGRRTSMTSTANDVDILRSLIGKKKSFADISVVGADEEQQIVKYDHGQLADIRVMLAPWSRGSIFRRSRIWWQIAFYIGLTVVIAVLFLRFIAAPAKINPDAVSKVSAYFNTFLPFLFGIYLNNIFTRWWAMRTQGVSGINNALNSMCVILAAQLQHQTLTEGPRAPDYTETKKLLLRYGLLAHELVYRAARKTDNKLQDLVASGALMPEECGLLAELGGGPCRPQAIWVWIQLLWDGLLQQKLIPWHVHHVVLHHIHEGRLAAKTIFTHLNTQIPFAYVHLIACLVHFNLIILALQAGMIISKAVGMIQNAKQAQVMEAGRHTQDTEATTLLITQMFYLTVVPLLYLGFLELSQEIADPFGTDLNDFPRAQFHNVMQDENESFIRTAECPPPALLRLWGSKERGCMESEGDELSCIDEKV